MNLVLDNVKEVTRGRCTAQVPLMTILMLCRRRRQHQLPQPRTAGGKRHPPRAHLATRRQRRNRKPVRASGRRRRRIRPKRGAQSPATSTGPVRQPCVVFVGEVGSLKPASTHEKTAPPERRSLLLYGEPPQKTALLACRHFLLCGVSPGEPLDACVKATCGSALLRSIYCQVQRSSRGSS